MPSCSTGKYFVNQSKHFTGLELAQVLFETPLPDTHTVNFQSQFITSLLPTEQNSMLNLPGLDIDIDAEIARYREYAEKIRPMVIDSVDWLTSE